MANNFRNLIPFKVPHHFQEGEGGLILHSLAILKDIALQRVRDGLEARMPRRQGPSARVLTGADRMIIRGKFETEADYAERLTQWRTGHHSHRARGMAWALLDQIYEYVRAEEGTGARCWTVDARKSAHYRGVDAFDSLVFDGEAEAYTNDYQGDWTWDATDPNVDWARFWVVLNANPELPWIEETPDFGDADLWGGAIGTPGYSVGLVGWNPTDTLAMRKLTRSRHPWRPGGTTPEWLVISLIDWTSAGEVQPDATWEHWSVQVAGTQTPTRSTDARYISLSPHINNVYAGDPALFCDDSTMVGGGTYAGDPTSFPASAVLPAGGTYAGNPASFPTSVQLLDDGDQVQ